MAEQTAHTKPIVTSDYGSLVIVAGALLALLSLAPRTERALLLGQEDATPRVLPVIIPPEPVVRIPNVRIRRPVAVPQNLVPVSKPTPPDEPGLRPIPLIFEPAIAPPIQLGPIGPLGFSVPFAPGQNNSPNASPLQTAADPAPILGAVPEPSTWMMMIVGFFGIGVGIRRQKRAGVRGISAASLSS